MKSDVIKCEDCNEILEDYFDKSLDQKRAAAVGLHLRQCAECAQKYELLSLEQQVYERYDRNVSVSPALWASIETRIQESPSTQVRKENSVSRLREWFGALASVRMNPVLVAAMVILAIGITVLVTRYFEHRQPNPTLEMAGGDATQKTLNPPAPAPTPDNQVMQPQAPEDQKLADNRIPNRPPVPRKPTTQQLIRDAEQKYLTAIAVLSRDVKNRKSSLDPQSLARFESALAVIDNTINETKRATRKDPNDPIALQYLLASYSKKVDVLREMARE